MTNTQRDVVVKEGGRIEGPPIPAEGDGPTVAGQLRKGYTMQIGSGRSARTVFGPAIIPLDRATAKLHLHKFDNKAEIRAAFGWPKPTIHESLEESVKKRIDELNARRRGSASVGVPGPPVDAMVREAVTREFTALRAELPGLIAEVLKQDRPSPPRAQPAARRAPTTAKV